MTHALTQYLNPEQAEAVTATEGPVLVVAGPGSGKTRVLTHRIAYLMDARNIPAYQIMAVTFTNKAADEMKERILKMGYHTQGMFLGTFHAICARILRTEIEQLPDYRAEFVIYDTSEQRSLIARLLKEYGYDSKQHRPIDVLAHISNAKNDLLGPDEMPVDGGYEMRVAQEIYVAYADALRDNNAMDFDDLLMETVLLFRNNPRVLEVYQQRLHYLLVDEFQDTNFAQYELVRLLSGERRNLFAVGDPDQSIYAFRGADYRNLRRLESDFSGLKIIKLTQNYRSHQNILDAAMAIIRLDPNHILRELVSQTPNGPRVTLLQTENSYDEAAVIASKINQLRREEGYGPRDFVIVYRVNAQSRALEKGLVDANIPYMLLGGLRFYERQEIKNMLAYFYVIHNPDDRARFTRMVQNPRRGIGEKSIASIYAWAKQQGGMRATLQGLAAGQLSNPLSGRGAAQFAQLAQHLVTWMQMNANGVPLERIYDDIVQKTDYLEYQKNSAKSHEQANSRLDNLHELRLDLEETQTMTLGAYLEQVSLLSDIDQSNNQVDVVYLMTMHSAKGLEFPVVFMPGLEDDILPHSRSHGMAESIAEERRLMYVGMTRAKERLYLIYAKHREQHRDPFNRRPSRFLYDLPAQQLDMQADEFQMGFTTQHPALHWSNSTTRRPPTTTFAVGDIVKHRKFGVGQVQKVTTYDDIQEVEVLFDGKVRRRLAGSFLEKA